MVKIAAVQLTAIILCAFVLVSLSGCARDLARAAFHAAQEDLVR